MAEIFLKEESYKLIGICKELHRELGLGFKEVIYKDALEIELGNNNIPFIREKLHKVEHKGVPLLHKFSADFIVYDAIIIEIKSASMIVDRFIAQTINYLKDSGLKLGIKANFGEKSFTYKRIVF